VPAVSVSPLWRSTASGEPVASTATASLTGQMRQPLNSGSLRALWIRPVGGVIALGQALEKRVPHEADAIAQTEAGERLGGA